MFEIGPGRTWAPLGYWVPSSPMPRPAFPEPDHGQPTATDQSVLGQRVHGVLTACRGEPARRQSQRRDGVSVELDEEDHHTSRQVAHCTFSINVWVRRTPLFSCCSSRVDIASRLLGKARITMRSSGLSSARTVRATCRSRRETWWRCTALPTAFDTTRPIRGPSSPPTVRRACTTISGCAARTPCLMVAPNSADRVIRYWAGSTPRDPRGSGSQRTTTLAAPARHDGAPGARTHAQTEAMDARPAPVVRLEGPLALGHGCLSLLRMAVAVRCTRLRCTPNEPTARYKLWSRS